MPPTVHRNCRRSLDDWGSFKTTLTGKPAIPSPSDLNHGSITKNRAKNDIYRCVNNGLQVRPSVYKPWRPK